MRADRVVRERGRNPAGASVLSTIKSPYIHVCPTEPTAVDQQPPALMRFALLQQLRVASRSAIAGFKRQFATHGGSRTSLLNSFRYTSGHRVVLTSILTMPCTQVACICQCTSKLECTSIHQFFKASTCPSALLRVLHAM